MNSKLLFLLRTHFLPDALGLPAIGFAGRPALRRDRHSSLPRSFATRVEVAAAGRGRRPGLRDESAGSHQGGQERLHLHRHQHHLRHAAGNTAGQADVRATALSVPDLDRHSDLRRQRHRRGRTDHRRYRRRDVGIARHGLRAELHRATDVPRNRPVAAPIADAIRPVGRAGDSRHQFGRGRVQPSTARWPSPSAPPSSWHGLSGSCPCPLAPPP